MKMTFHAFVFTMFGISTLSLIGTPQSVASEIINLLQAGSDKDYIGEEVSQLQHALQAAQLARDSQCDNETIIAALLHDIGHMCSDKNAEQMAGFGTAQHEMIGGKFLRDRGFGQKVIAIVQGHVNAKRYLCYKNPTYYNALTIASKETLKFQGGPMNVQEAEMFQANPSFNEILLVRSFDEKAKDKNAIVQNLESYRAMIINHLLAQSPQ
jgi:putative nucleotidyltransferase with HDIG domain